MLRNLIFESPSFVMAGILFICMLIFIKLGSIASKKGLFKKDKSIESGFGAIEGSLLGLLALLLGFTFNMASSRFDQRRDTMIQEVNHIHVAVLRAELYPDSIKQILKKDLKEYVETRISYYEAGEDKDSKDRSVNSAHLISDKLWGTAASYVRTNENSFVISNQMIPALNEMIDIVATRDSKLNAQVPVPIIILLMTLCLVAGFVAGYCLHEKKRDWVILFAFCLMISISFNMILDLDRSRAGFITLDDSHKKMLQLREMFK